MRRLLRAVLVAALVAVWSAAASAAATTVFVEGVVGKKGDDAKEAIVLALAETRGVSLVGNPAAASRVIRGSIRKAKKRWRLTVTVVTSASVQVAQHTFVNKRFKRVLKAVAGHDWSALVNTAGPAATTPGPAAEKKVVADPPPAKPAPAAKNDEPLVPQLPGATAEADAARDDGGLSSVHAPLEIVAAMRLTGRSLTYNDDFFGALNGYELPLAPGFQGGLVWYPGAHFTDGPGAHFGLRVEGYTIPGVTSENSAGVRYQTLIHGVSAALDARLPLGDHALGAVVGWAWDHWTFDTSDRVAAETSYHSVRLAGRARFQLPEHVTIGLLVGWQFVLDGGAFYSDDWFPRASGGGIEASLDVAWLFFEGLGVHASFTFRRFAFDMDSRPGDKAVAGGALDQRMTGTVGLTYRFGAGGMLSEP